MDRFLKDSKILRLHAILHDAAGCYQEYYNQGMGYAYMLPCDINSLLQGILRELLFVGIQNCLNLSLFIC